LRCTVQKYHGIMVEGVKQTTKCLGWFRHQQTYYLEDHKYETAVLSLHRNFSTIMKCKNIDILVHIYVYTHTRKQTFKNT